MKHLIFRFFKNSIKSYTIANEIFDDLYQIFDDSNRRTNVLKAYRRLKQIESFKDFNIFWAEFQRLTSDSELYNQETLLEDLKNKMSYELQKAFAIESYKVIDLHEFIKMCRYTDQLLRDVNNKFKNIRKDFANDVEREEVIVIVIWIRIIRSIKTSINRFHAHDLKSLNRVFVRLLNHQKIRWTVSIITIVKNLIISFVIVVNLENQWISTASYKK